MLGILISLSMFAILLTVMIFLLCRSSEKKKAVVNTADTNKSSGTGNRIALMLAGAGTGTAIALLSLIFTVFAYIRPPQMLSAPMMPDPLFSHDGMILQSDADEIWFAIDSDPADGGANTFKYDGEPLHVMRGQVLVARAKNSTGWSDKKILRGNDLEVYYLAAKQLDNEPRPIEVMEEIVNNDPTLKAIQEQRRRENATSTVVLNTSELTLKVDETTDLIANISPDSLQGETLIWSTDNQDVAVVSSAGRIKALAPGKAVISVSYNNYVLATCMVQVEPKEKVEDKKQIESQVTAPASSPIPWVRDYSKPAGKAESEATLEINKPAAAETPAVNTHTVDTPTMTVNEASSSEKSIRLQYITLPGSVSINVGDVLLLPAEYFPEGATASAKWTSADPATVKVNDSGAIMGLKKGTTSVKVRAGSVSATVEVIVNEIIVPLEKISIRNVPESEPFEVESGTSFHAYYDITPLNATTSDLTYEIPDTSVAVVDRYGNVTGRNAGITTLTISAGGLSATHPIRVTPAVFVDKIILSDTDLELFIGKDHVITPTIEPALAAKKKITWSSSNPEIVTVSDGVITALKEGTAVVTASSGSTTAKCKIKAKNIPIESIEFTTSEIEVNVGQTVPFGYTVSPYNATIKSSRAKSSDEKIARIVDNSIVGIREGTCTISLTIDGITETCNVSVLPMVYESITFAESTSSVEVDSSFRPHYTTYPPGADSRTVTWSSSNPKVAEVIDGVIQGKSIGATWITASIGQVRDYVMVYVTATPVREIYLAESQLLLEIGDSSDINYTIQPANAVTQNITIKSSDESVVKVYNNKIHAMAIGSATVTVSADGVQAQLSAVVRQVSPKAIIFDTTDLALEPGDQETIGVRLEPIQADLNAISWKSSNTSVIRVENGMVTALREGTAVIVAYYDNHITASCNVTVKRKIVDAEEILLPQMSQTINIGESWSITPVVYPSTTTNKALLWDSSDMSVISIDQDGRLVALSSGTATITIRCGNAQNSFTLSVAEAVVLAEEILLPELPHTINVGSILELSPAIFPATTSDKALRWDSSQPTVISVDQSGRIEALSSGFSVVTIRCNNIRQSFTLYVSEPAPEPLPESLPEPVIMAEAISLPELPTTINIGTILELSPSVSPGNASDKALYWESDQPSVVFADQTGKLTALASGSAKITIRCGAAQQSFILNVAEPVTYDEISE